MIRIGRTERSVLAAALVLGLGVPVLGQQPLGEAYWQGIRAKADSVLVAEFGKEFREKHIFDPQEPLDYIVVDDDGIDWDDRDTITRIPQYCLFEYCVSLSKAAAISTRPQILFTITPQGERVPASVEPKAEWMGFTDCHGACQIPYDGAGFIAVSRKNGVRVRRKNGFRGLEWIPPDSLEWEAGKRTGRYELTLGQDMHQKGKTPTSGGGAFYWNLYKVAVFDLFTGDLLRVEENHEVYMIACGVGNL
ncbi:MAG: hypothetical protein KF797_02440 [Flavobacteriales bacterium]|nr:hypothetical protein [Flavobacteriales bacterium]